MAGVHPIRLVHPDLVQLMREKNVFPEVPDPEEQNLTEDILAESIGLAISLLDHEEQLDMLSRIMTDEEVAVQGLQHPDIRELDQRIILTSEERKVILQGETEPDPRDVQIRVQGECLICSEEGRLTLPCGCNYCMSCFREAIRVGLRSEQAFPPRCCIPLGERTIRHAERPALVHLYRQLDLEYQTPAPERLYCYDGRCATFIPRPVDHGCRACGRFTCQNCRREAHPGQACGEMDGMVVAEEEDVWAAMDDNGAVNCPGCGRMVELRDGCNHLTCVCGAQFCYLCGHFWRHCGCRVYGHHDDRVPIRQRPGLKPERWRRVWRRDPNARDRPPPAVQKIPHLRPWPGEQPLGYNIPRRVYDVEWTETPGRDVPPPPPDEPAVQENVPVQPAQPAEMVRNEVPAVRILDPIPPVNDVPAERLDQGQEELLNNAAERQQFSDVLRRLERHWQGHGGLVNERREELVENVRHMIQNLDGRLEEYHSSSDDPTSSGGSSVYGNVRRRGGTRHRRERGRVDRVYVERRDRHNQRRIRGHELRERERIRRERRERRREQYRREQRRRREDGEVYALPSGRGFARQRRRARPLFHCFAGTLRMLGDVFRAGRGREGARGVAVAGGLGVG